MLQGVKLFLWISIDFLDCLIIKHIFSQIVFNTFIVTGACVYGPFAWLRSWRLQYKPLVAPQKYEVSVLPEFHWVLIELAVCVIVEEFLFYYCHRMLHHKRVSVSYLKVEVTIS